jgi:hypothetical protein
MLALKTLTLLGLIGFGLAADCMSDQGKRCKTKSEMGGLGVYFLGGDPCFLSDDKRVRLVRHINDKKSLLKILFDIFPHALTRYKQCTCVIMFFNNGFMETSLCWIIFNLLNYLGHLLVCGQTINFSGASLKYPATWNLAAANQSVDVARPLSCLSVTTVLLLK